MLVTSDMEIDIEQISRELSALEQFVDALPEKADRKSVV